MAGNGQRPQGASGSATKQAAPAGDPVKVNSSLLPLVFQKKMDHPGEPLAVGTNLSNLSFDCQQPNND